MRTNSTNHSFNPNTTDHEPISDEQRSTLLKQLKRASAMIGTTIPQQFSVDDHTVELRKWLRTLRKKAERSETAAGGNESGTNQAGAGTARIDEDDADGHGNVERDAEKLGVLINQRLETIKSTIGSEPVEPDAAEALVEEALGLKRALEILDDIRAGKGDDEWARQKTQQEALEDARRWLDYMKKVT